MTTRWRRLASLGALGLLAGACQLSEIATAPAADVLVVEAVLQTGRPRQTLLLHRSVSGRRVRGESGARVSVVTPQGREVPFEEVPLGNCVEQVFAGIPGDSLRVEPTCYASSPWAELVIEPGATYELRVETISGERLRGRTTVPGPFFLRSPHLEGDACALPPGRNLPLVWSVAEGAWSYLAGIEIQGLRAALAGTGIDAPDRVHLTGLAISEQDTTLSLPAQFGLFEVVDVDQELLKYLQNGFPPEVSVRLTIAAVDRNFVNAVRGGSFNPSGAVRIGSVVGDGIGVFASVQPVELFIDVSDSSRLPSCL